MSQHFASFKNFYPYYLSEHADLTCRRLHFVGSTGALVCVVAALWTLNPYWLLGGLLIGYGFAWIGHFFFEKNRPATFKNPLYSFIADWVMYADIWRGKVRV